MTMTSQPRVLGSKTSVDESHDYILYFEILKTFSCLQKKLYKHEGAYLIALLSFILVIFVIYALPVYAAFDEIIMSLYPESLKEKRQVFHR